MVTSCKRPFNITTLLYIDGACPPLTAPDDGTIDCSLGDDGFATEGDSCTLHVMVHLYFMAAAVGPVKMM